MRTVKLTQREQKMITDFIYEQLKDTIIETYGECLIDCIFMRFESFNFSDVAQSEKTFFSLYMTYSHLNLYVEFSFDEHRRFAYFHRVMVTQ